MLQTLCKASEIQQRVEILGREITDYYRGKPLTVMIIINGGMVFGADLIRHINLPFFVDTIAVSSYQHDVSAGTVNFRCGPKLDFTGRHILLVDDILDTGLTLRKVSGYFLDKNALSVKSCVLCDKMLKDPTKKQFSCDWFGIRVPDQYLIGYGLDSEELYRNLPDIMAIIQE